MAETTSGASSALGKPSRGVYGSDLMVEVLRELGIRYIALNPGATGAYVIRWLTSATASRRR
jgi:hypothetical protein